ncbi:MAG: hypothetical protein AMXMBFR13_29390 [Phycisphaerae bacterium]|jgi:hypothetical protein
MKKKPVKHLRIKLIAMALGALAVGVTLLVLSGKVQPADTAPAAAPATAPADEHRPTEAEITARNMSGILLLFGLVAILLSIVCVGWLVYDIRQSRPAWIRNPRYPQRR